MKFLKRIAAYAVAVALGGSSLVSVGASAADDDGLIADFTFETVGSPLDGGEAIGNVQGTAAFVDGPDGKAARLSSGFWIDVTKKDGSPLLAGLNDVTISYDSKPDSGGNIGWTVFAAPNTVRQEYGTEKYLGYLDKTTGVTVERYANTSGRDTSGNLTVTKANAEWKHVDLAISGNTARLYIDKKLVAVNTIGKTLSEILGSTGGILQLGKANWATGEYYSGLLDNVKIYDRALTGADLGVEPAKTDIRAALSIPSKVSDDLPSSILGKKVTWSALGEGADLVSPEGVVTRPESGSVSVTLSASIEGVEDPVSASVEILDDGGAVASYVKTVTLKDGQKDDPLAYDDDRRADALFVSAKAAGSDEWEPLNRSQAILYVKWSGAQDSSPNAQMGSPSFFRFADGTLGAVASQNNGTDSVYIWNSTDGVTFTGERVVKVALDGSIVSDPKVTFDASTGRYKIFWNDLADGDGRVATRSDLSGRTDPSEATRADALKLGVAGDGLPPFATQSQASEFAMSKAEFKEFYTGYADLTNTGVKGIPEVKLESGDELVVDDLPASATMEYSDGTTKDLAIEWEQDDIDAIDTAVPGEYEVQGLVKQTPEEMVFDARADPDLFFNDDDGYWYLTGSHYLIPSDAPNGDLIDRNAYRKIGLKRAKTIDGLKDAAEQIVIDPDAGTPGLENQYPNTFYGWGGYIWAQEFHKINGTWWIIAGMHRGYAPTNGWCNNTVMIPYVGSKESLAAGGLIDSKNWGEPTVLEGAAFDVSYMEREENGTVQGYWIMPSGNRLLIGKAKMGEPGTVPLVDGQLREIYAISWPWEYGKQAPTPADTSEGRDQGVIEGPFMIEYGDYVYITYSGGTVDKYYDLGLLRAKKDTDLQNPDSWTQMAFPALTTNDTADGRIAGVGHGGTGHNSLAIDEVGNLVLAYHARPYPEQHTNAAAGGLFDPDRNSWFKSVNVRANGMLDMSMNKDQEVAAENRTVSAKVVVAGGEEDASASLAATTRCVAGKVVLAGTITNKRTKPLTGTMNSIAGSKGFTELAAGKSTSAAFSTRVESVPAGTISAVLESGETVEANYSEASCGKAVPDTELTVTVTPRCAFTGVVIWATITNNSKETVSGTVTLPLTDDSTTFSGLEPGASTAVTFTVREKTILGGTMIVESTTGKTAIGTYLPHACN